MVGLRTYQHPGYINGSGKQSSVINTSYPRPSTCTDVFLQNIQRIFFCCFLSNTNKSRTHKKKRTRIEMLIKTRTFANLLTNSIAVSISAPSSFSVYWPPLLVDASLYLRCTPAPPPPHCPPPFTCGVLEGQCKNWVNVARQTNNCL